ncbi:MAG: ATP-binding cassette domain-containing protein [Leucobacter sp.]
MPESPTTRRLAQRAASAAPAEGAAHLSVTELSKSYADRRVLSGISFHARPGDRIGVIGENGSGKSTLLRILGGLERADDGTVAHSGSVGSLTQELPYPDDAPLGRVLDDAQHGALAARARIEDAARALAQRPEDPATAQDYADALEEAERAGAWEAEALRGETLTGLGLAGIAEDAPVGALSGGQRLRLALAALLLQAPHLILLDEPSNHLDDGALAYLEGVLRAWPGIVIFVSHDRSLLDAVATRILDFDPSPVPAAVLADAVLAEAVFTDPAPVDASSAPGAADLGVEDPETEDPETEDPGSGIGVRVWGTGYSAAREAQRAELSRWRERYAAEQQERAELIHEIQVGSREVNRKHESKSESRITRKFYADKDARVTARRARGARVRLEQLERVRLRRPPEPLRFAGFAAAADPRTPLPVAQSAEPALQVQELAVAGRLAPTSFEVERGGRLLLAGPNGAGKSTLLTILATAATAATPTPTIGAATGAIPGTAPASGPGAAAERLQARGRIAVAPDARIGYLPQETPVARPDRTAAEAYADAVGAELAEQRPLTASGLLAPRDARQAVGALSVGQRRRLALASLIADPPEILLLDEPSNHLSLTLVEELEEALEGFEGALIIATHDRRLRSRWEEAVLTLAPAGP